MSDDTDAYSILGVCLLRWLSSAASNERVRLCGGVTIRRIFPLPTARYLRSLHGPSQQRTALLIEGKEGRYSTGNKLGA